jgi:hypothetical protein
MNCPMCSIELLWGQDFDSEDFGQEAGGIVSVNTCVNPACSVQTVEVYTNNEV